MQRFSINWFFYLIIGIFLAVFFITPVLAASPVKADNYQDFTKWYLKKYDLEETPWRAAVVIEAETYTPLYYHQESRVMPTASLIKLVTAGAVVRSPINWWQRVGFSWADNEGDLRPLVEPRDTFSLLKIKENDTVTVERAFASMLIGSANNAANRFTTFNNNRENFLNKMRQVALTWGMLKTTIVEPTGLSLENTSTAADMANGVCHALENFITQFYASKPSYSFTTTLGEEKTVKHTVHKLRADPKRWFGAKTGYLRETGYHLAAGFITPEGKRICASILSTKSRATSESVLYDMGEWVDQMYSW
ncbi:MAG: serine hydrolase [Patescibacteria group bacterium]